MDVSVHDSTCRIGNFLDCHVVGVDMFDPNPDFVPCGRHAVVRLMMQCVCCISHTNLEQTNELARVDDTRFRFFFFLTQATTCADASEETQSSPESADLLASRLRFDRNDQPTTPCIQLTLDFGLRETEACRNLNTARPATADLLSMAPAPSLAWTSVRPPYRRESELRRCKMRASRLFQKHDK